MGIAFTSIFNAITQFFTFFTTMFSAANRLANATETWAGVVETNAKVMADEADYERQKKRDLIAAKQAAYKTEALQLTQS